MGHLVGFLGWKGDFNFYSNNIMITCDQDRAEIGSLLSPCVVSNGVTFNKSLGLCDLFFPSAPDC